MPENGTLTEQSRPLPKRKTDSSLIRAVQIHVGNVVVKDNSSEEMLTTEGSLNEVISFRIGISANISLDYFRVVVLNESSLV